MGDGSDDPAMGPRTGGIERPRQEDVLDLEHVYAVLDHPRRRRLLQLVDEFDTATTRDLANHIAAMENDVSPHEVTESERQAVTVALYHVHIPKLVDAGVIEANDGMDSVSPGPYADQVLAALRGLYAEFEDESISVESSSK